MRLPIQEALQIIREANLSPTTKVAVGFSGGKDSVALLSLLVKERGPHLVEPFYMYLVKDLRCVENTVDAVAEKLGVHVHKVPHWDLARMIKYAVLMPHINGREKIREQRLCDVEASISVKTGATWFSYGWRKNDGYMRKIMFKRWGYVWKHSNKLFPIASWSTNEIMGYIRSEKLPTPVSIKSRDNQLVTGFALEENILMKIKKNYPDDWKKILEVFPFADVLVFRAEMEGKI